jgi:hypothetical protein
VTSGEEQSTLTWEGAMEGAGRFSAGVRRDRSWRGKAVRWFAVAFLVMLLAALVSAVWSARGDDGDPHVAAVREVLVAREIDLRDVRQMREDSNYDRLIVDGVKPTSVGQLNDTFLVRWAFLETEGSVCVEAVFTASSRDERRFSCGPVPPDGPGGSTELTD